MGNHPRFCFAVCSTGALLVTENLRGEYFDRRSTPPGIGGKPSFVTGLLQKRHAIPIVFYSYLRQEQAPAAVHADQKSVASDFDVLGSNGLRRR